MRGKRRTVGKLYYVAKLAGTLRYSRMPAMENERTELFRITACPVPRCLVVEGINQLSLRFTLPWPRPFCGVLANGTNGVRSSLVIPLSCGRSRRRSGSRSP